MCSFRLAMELNLREVVFGALGIGAVAGILSRGAVAPTSQIFGRVLHRLEGESAKRSVALTFDDGPNPAVTPHLLALLERHNARATFFVMGRYARECPELIREIAARGHLLGNHTETHANLVWKSRAQIAPELAACRDIVLEALGADCHQHMQWLRPPFGFRGPQLARAAREFAPAGIATWCRMAHDWRPQPAAPVIARLARVRGSDIVLLHDGDHRRQNGDRAHVVAALEHWLPRWRDAGLEFVTIPNGAAAS